MASPARASVCGSRWATTGAPADMYSLILTNVASRLTSESTSGATQTSAARRVPRSGRARRTNPSHWNDGPMPRSRAPAAQPRGRIPSPATTTLIGRGHARDRHGVNQMVDVVLLTDRADVCQEVGSPVAPARIRRHLR